MILEIQGNSCQRLRDYIALQIASLRIPCSKGKEREVFLNSRGITSRLNADLTNLNN